MDSYVVEAIAAVISLATLWFTRNYLIELREVRKEIKRLRVELKRRRIYRIIKRKRS